MLCLESAGATFPDCGVTAPNAPITTGIKLRVVGSEGKAGGWTGMLWSHVGELWLALEIRGRREHEELVI